MNIVTADQFAILRLWARNLRPVRLQSGGLENENQNRGWNRAIYTYKLELSLSDSTQFVLQYQLTDFWTLEITSQIWYFWFTNAGNVWQGKHILFSMLSSTISYLNAAVLCLFKSAARWRTDFLSCDNLNRMLGPSNSIRVQL